MRSCATPDAHRPGGRSPAPRRASSRSRRASPSRGPRGWRASRTPSSPAMAADPLTASVHFEATPETGVGSSSTRAVAEHELVAGHDARTAQAPSQQPRAVAGAEVDRQPGPVDRAQLEVTSRHRGLAHHDVATVAAPDDDRACRGELQMRGGHRPRRAPPQPRSPDPRDVGHENTQLVGRPRTQRAAETMLERVDAEIALDAARPQQGDGPLAIAIRGAHHDRDAPPPRRLRQPPPGQQLSRRATGAARRRRGRRPARRQPAHAHARAAARAADRRARR
jgi:hypothetical protein